MIAPRPLVAAVTLLFGAGAVVIVVAGDDDERSSEAFEKNWTALHPAKLSRTEVGAARIGRYVYVVGGFEQRTGATTAAVERYDIVRNRWRRVRSMPVGLNHPAVAAYRGDVYVLGGYTGRGDLRGEVSSLYRYRPQSNHWSRLPSAPTRRAALAIGASRGKLYAAGGANTAEGALNTLEIYDFRKRRWSRGPDMQFAREHLAGVVAGGNFYALAGRAAGRGNFKVVERYVQSTGRWKRLPDMQKARGGIAAAVVDRRIVVFGGEEAQSTIKEVELYDPALRRWTSLPDMRTPRHGLGGVARGRRVYAIEGGPMPGFHFSDAVEALDITPRRIAGG